MFSQATTSSSAHKLGFHFPFSLQLNCHAVLAEDSPAFLVFMTACPHQIGLAANVEVHWKTNPDRGVFRPGPLVDCSVTGSLPCATEMTRALGAVN